MTQPCFAAGQREAQPSAVRSRLLRRQYRPEFNWSGIRAVIDRLHADKGRRLAIVQRARQSADFAERLVKAQLEDLGQRRESCQLQLHEIFAA